MKKLAFLILILIVGCTNKLEIGDNIIEIKYNNYYISNYDFYKVKKMINKNFKRSSKRKLSDKLTIKTNKNIYYFSLDDNFIEYNGKVAENNRLNSFLKKLSFKYISNDFYTVQYVKKYETSKQDKFISIDKNSNYIIFNFNDDIYDFKIYEIEKNGDNFRDVNLIYDDKSSNRVIIRKTVNYNIPDIRISFKNKYGYTFSIIPCYMENIEFDTKVYKKIAS